MITLTYPQKNSTVEKTIDRLNSLVVKYKLEENKEAKDTMLIHNSKSYKGASSIENYLNKLSEELEEWRVIECDRYYFE
ncbi:MAG: hypothetical protein AAF363_02055 [Bacteroidota bacterium]